MPDTFTSHLSWTGSRRDLTWRAASAVVPMSSAPAFQGDPARVNPEQMFVGALSACQALTLLALAERHQIPIVAYEDDAEGALERVDGRMRMSRVVLRPRITLDGIADDAAAAETVAKTREVIARAHAVCFIANSVTATITIEPTIAFQGEPCVTSGSR